MNFRYIFSHGKFLMKFQTGPITLKSGAFKYFKFISRKNLHTITITFNQNIFTLPEVQNLPEFFSFWTVPRIYFDGRFRLVFDR